MRYKTLVRILVKLLGVYFMVAGIAATGWAIAIALRPSLGSWQVWREILFQLINPALQIAAGAYLFFGGKWLVSRIIPSNRPYCHECGYELTGLPAKGQCPECATPYRGNEQTAAGE